MKGVFIDGCGSGQLQAACPMIGGAVFSPVIVVSLEVFHQLEPSCWVGQACAKMATSRKLTLKRILGVNHQVSWSRGATDLPLSPQRPSKTHKQVCPHSSWSHCLALVPVHMKPCLCPPRVELFPSLGEPSTQAPSPSQLKSARGLLLLMPDLQAGESDIGSGSRPKQNLCDIIVFQFVVCPLRGLGFHHIMKVLLLPTFVRPYFFVGILSFWWCGSLY